jgi:hypothetical protein
MIRTIRLQTGSHHVLGHDLDQTIYIKKFLRPGVKYFWVSNILPRGVEFDTFAQCRRAVLDHLRSAA